MIKKKKKDRFPDLEVYNLIVRQKDYKIRNANFWHWPLT